MWVVPHQHRSERNHQRQPPQLGQDKHHQRLWSDVVELLYQTHVFRSESSRELATDLVTERLGTPVRMRHHANPRLHIIELVRACAEFSHGLNAIVEAMILAEPGTRETIMLQRLRDEWEVRDLLTTEDLTVLRPALEAFPISELGGMEQMATSGQLPQPPLWCASAWQVFVNLLGANAGSDGMPPSVVFLEFLADVIENEVVAESIRARNRRFVTAYGLVRELDAIPHRRAGRGSPPAAFLVIQLDPDFIDSDLYILSHWRQWSSGAWRPVRGDDLLVHEDEIEREVEKLVATMETQWSDRPADVTIEFVLPWDLLNRGVEWWHKESSSNRPTPLAMDYPVVVRSLERLRTSRWHRAWHDRWRRLVDEPTHSRLHWSNPSGGDYFTRLESELKADTGLVSLVLSAPPESTSIGRQEVETALRAGLPVIVWHRLDCSSAEFRETVIKLVADRGWQDLPARVRKLRLDALRLEPNLRENHVGRHLTIMWDDPERKPGSPRLRSDVPAGRSADGW